MKCFLIIGICIFSYDSILNSQSFYPIDLNHGQPSLSTLFCEEIFLKQFEEADFNKEFRIIIKTLPTLDNLLLSNFGKKITQFNSYQGLAISISKMNLLDLIQRHVIAEIWNNSLIYGSNSIDELSISESRSLTDYNEKIDKFTKDLKLL